MKYQAKLLEQVLAESKYLSGKALGGSMWPFLRATDRLIIERISGCALSRGDVVLFRIDERFIVHRVLDNSVGDSTTSLLLTKGDACRYPDPIISQDQILGKMVGIERNGRYIDLSSFGRSAQAQILRILSLSGPVWYYLLRMLYYSVNPRNILPRLRRM